MKFISFFAQGIPKAQPRVKATSFGGFTRVYDPGTAKDWKTIVRHSCSQHWDKVPFAGPVEVNISVFFQRPKAHFNKAGLKATAPRYHTTKPDAENCSKAILDALSNLGIWRDDSQAASVWTLKFYTNTETTGAQISVKELRQ